MRSTATTLLLLLLAVSSDMVSAQSTTKVKPPTPKPAPAQAGTSARRKSSLPKSTTAKGTPPKTAFARTTLSGVYTAEEARAGRDIYAGLCASCHTAVTHTGPEFRKKWTGKPLSDLFTYMRTMMPKNEPASLADEDYGVLLAYMLQLNKMPAGREPLSTDSLILAKIRIDIGRTIKVAKPSG